MLLERLEKVGLDAALPTGPREYDDFHTGDLIHKRAIIDFETRIKPQFCNNGHNWAINLGIALDFPDVEIKEGYMIFSNEDILS